MKELFDESIQSERFNIAPVTAGVFDNTKYTTYKTQLEEHFTPKQTKKILQATIRFSFYIEPVKQPKIETTNLK